MPPLPPAPRAPRRPVFDDYHGEQVEDPYRWLEDPASAETRAWTDAQNARTRGVLDALPARNGIAARLRELMSVGVIDTPRPIAGRIFHLRRGGDQKQWVLYVRDGLYGQDRAVVDPNELDASGATVLDWYYPSPDAKLVAYGLSRGGTEMSTLHLRDLATGKDLSDRIPHTQRGQVAWAGTGFYYTVNPAPGTVTPGDEHYHRRVRYHRLGDDPARDGLVFGEGRPKEDIVGVQTSPDGRWVLLTANVGWLRNDLYLLDRADGRIATIREGRDGLSTATLARDGLWIRTNVDAPNERIVHAPYEDPARWRTVVPEGEHAVEGHDVTRDRIVVHTLVRATSRLTVWTREGVREREIELPGIGSIGGLVQRDLDADIEGDLATYVFQSFVMPPIAFALDASSGAVAELVRAPAPPGLDPDAFVVEQTAYRSTDGEEVTMFLLHRRDVAPSGGVPTVLTGYGGFNLSRRPQYIAGAALWAERGGLFALPSLRGGNEYGERWHRGGMLERKQQVFDDFHAAAEALVERGWTAPSAMGCYGGSNGGLLVGAALTQRPDLFAAVVCAVPLLDMLRYQRLLIARFWIAEYGSSEDPAQYRWLRAYSPYHHVRAGPRYPAVLFTTGEGDSRVDPMHARKMAALLQEAAGPGACVLLRVDRETGHGVGKPLDLQVADEADRWSFFAWRLGAGGGNLAGG